MMKLVSALPLLLLALESSSAFTARNLQDIVELPNATTKVYEPPAAYNDTVITYPEGFWLNLNDSFIVYDTFGLMNDTVAPPGVIEYAPMAVESMTGDNFTGYDLPVAYYYTTGVNESSPVPLYSIPKTFLRGGDNNTLVAMPSGVAPMMFPDEMYTGPMMLSTVPLQDMPVLIMDEAAFMDFALLNGTTNETFPIKYVGQPVFLSNGTEPVMMPFLNTTEVTPETPLVNKTEVFFPIAVESTPEVPEAVFLNHTEEVYYTMSVENNTEGPINVTILPEVVFNHFGQPGNGTLQPPEFVYSTTGEPGNETMQPPEFVYSTTGEPGNETMQPPEFVYSTTGEPGNETMQPPEFVYSTTGEPGNETMQPPEFVYNTAGEPVNVTFQPPEIVYSTTGVETPPIVIQPPPMTLPIKNSGEDNAGKPAWWGLVKDTHKDVKSCKKRKNVAPVTGDRCSKKMEKTCFFGNQECPTTTYPATVCKCTAGTWSCSAATCP